MSESVVLPVPTDDASSLGAGPLVFTFPISADVSVQTTVLGTARNVAAVAILNGSITVYSVTLTQAFPEAKTTYPLQIGGMRIDTGADLRLTIPTETQLGQVVFSATIEENGVSQQFAAQVASWPLSSSI